MIKSRFQHPIIERFEQDTRALPPVIGIILLVAIAVILAALIGTFTLGYAVEQDAGPQASWVINENPNMQSDHIAFEHDGGDTVASGNLVLRVDGIDGDLLPEEDRTLDSGATVTFSHEELTSGMVVRLVWQQPGSDSTHVLREHTITQQFD